MAYHLLELVLCMVVYIQCTAVSSNALHHVSIVFDILQKSVLTGNFDTWKFGTYCWLIMCIMEIKDPAIDFGELSDLSFLS
jgi:hypothetical protein